MNQQLDERIAAFLAKGTEPDQRASHKPSGFTDVATERAKEVLSAGADAIKGAAPPLVGSLVQTSVIAAASLLGVICSMGLAAVGDKDYLAVRHYRRARNRKERN